MCTHLYYMLDIFLTGPQVLIVFYNRLTAFSFNVPALVQLATLDLSYNLISRLSVPTITRQPQPFWCSNVPYTLLFFLRSSTAVV